MDPPQPRVPPPAARPVWEGPLSWSQPDPWRSARTEAHGGSPSSPSSLSSSRLMEWGVKASALQPGHRHFNKGHFSKTAKTPRAPADRLVEFPICGRRGEALKTLTSQLRAPHQPTEPVLALEAGLGCRQGPLQQGAPLTSRGPQPGAFTAGGSAPCGAGPSGPSLRGHSCGQPGTQKVRGPATTEPHLGRAVESASLNSDLLCSA